MTGVKTFYDVRKVQSDMALQIQAEEDRWIFEALDALILHSDGGNGICSRCFLPFVKGQECPIFGIMGIMDS